jgi:Tol biopolymer transport system component/DNA-binding winged helix-turn-helix (wHTH) protein
MAAMLQPDRLIYSFGGFQLDAHKRLLLREGQTVPLSSKAFDLLLALVESGGREVAKDELMERVWADQLVEDANLTVTMSHLRKALGEKASDHRFIVTIPGRGYRFVSELQPCESLIVERHNVSQVVIELDDEDESTGAVIGNNAIARGDSYAARSADLTTAVAPQRAPSRATTKSSRRFVFGGLILAGLIAVGLAVAGYEMWKAKNLAAIPFAGAPLKQLTTKGRIGHAALSPDGKFYAYALLERGEYKQSLWLGQVDGTGDIQLRPPAEVSLNGMAFSPDSQTLYFDQNSVDQSQRGLFKLPVLGGVAEKLSDEIRANFAVSPDGRQVAFFHASKDQNGSALVISNLDGTGWRELLARPPDKSFSARPAWSPDGSLLAFSAISDSGKDSHELFVLRLANGHLEQLPARGWIQISNLVWAGGGRGLIAVAADKKETVRHIWHVAYPDGSAQRISNDTDTNGAALSISADGSSLLAAQLRRESNIWVAPAADLAQARQVTFSSINGIYGWHSFDWTPDNKIVFAAGVDRTVAIYVMDADGRNQKQVTSGGFFDQRLSVTADGRFIVFQSNRSGSNEIWRVNMDGSDLRQLTTGGANSSPHPTPDGQWVVYTSAHSGRSFVWRVPLAGGPPVRVMDKESTYPRVSPDGRYLACGYLADDDAPAQLALVDFAGSSLVRLFEAPRSANFNDGIRWTPDGQAICYRDLANGIWRQEMKGGAPQRLTGLPEEKLYIFGWSRDGRLFAFTRGREICDAVLVRDVR